MAHSVTVKGVAGTADGPDVNLVLVGTSLKCWTTELLQLDLIQGTLTERGRISSVDLLIKVGCFVKRVNNVCSI